MNDERLDDLIDQHLNGTLSDARRRELEACLLRSAADRERFWQLAETHVMLHEVLQQRLTSLATPDPAIDPKNPPLRPVNPRRFRWLPWSPVVAAAAGLAIGVFGASAAWAYASPVMPLWVKHVIALTNAAFEEDITPQANGVPVQYGVWSGDYAEIVGSQQGIAPHEGAHMFRFLRSDSVDPSSRGPILNGNIYQVVDIRSLRAVIADGTAIADWSTWFNCVPEQSAQKTKFVASVWAFAGDTSILPRNWADKLYQEIAYSSWNIVSDNNPQNWQRIAGSMVVPPDANFLVVELKVVPGDPMPVDGAVSFAGHYADDVVLTLRSNARAAPITLSTLKP